MSWCRQLPDGQSRWIVLQCEPPQAIAFSWGPHKSNFTMVYETQMTLTYLIRFVNKFKTSWPHLIVIPHEDILIGFLGVSCLSTMLANAYCFFKNVFMPSATGLSTDRSH